MINIKGLRGELRKKLAIILGEGNNLYPSKNVLPEWMPPIFEPKLYDYKKNIYKDVKFNITENVCGLTVNIGFIKRGILHNCLAYDKNGKQMPEFFSQNPKVQTILADILQHYNAESVVLQAKVLEKNNYYKTMPKILAFTLYIDGVEQTLKDMAEILREYNIEIVPVLALNKIINEETKENYSGQSLLANVPSKGIICTNRQKSLSFLL